MPEEIDKTCRTCEDEDTKSCRYPCSECDEYELDKWTKKIDRSDWKLEHPKMFEYDSKNDIVDIFIREDLKCPFPFHEEDWWHQGLYLNSFITYVNDLFERNDLQYKIVKIRELDDYLK